MQTKWIHSTNKENANNILRNGFKLPKESGRFGKAVYFANSIEFGRFGDTQLSARILGRILNYTHKELCDIYNTDEHQYQVDEEGIPQVETMVKNKGFGAVNIKYSDNSSELVVYNISMISEIAIIVAKKS